MKRTLVQYRVKPVSVSWKAETKSERALLLKRLQRCVDGQTT